MLGDNKSVITSTAVPSSALKKKHCAINYHRVREAIAAGFLRYVHIPSAENLADVITKPLPGHMIKDLVQPVLYPVPWKSLWPGFEIRKENMLKN